MTYFRHYDILAKTRRRIQTATTFSLTLVHPRALLRDGPLEKLLEEGEGEGNFRAAGIFFVIKFLVWIFFRP